MAFSTTTVRVGELLGPARDEGDLASAVGAALSANAVAADAIGGRLALGRAALGFLKGWNATNPDAARTLSADRVVTVTASVTSNLVTVQFQIAAVV